MAEDLELQGMLQITPLKPYTGEYNMAPGGDRTSQRSDGAAQLQIW